MQANAQKVWGDYLKAGIGVWQATVTPRTNSADNWATREGQTIMNADTERLIQAFNAWIRSNSKSLGLSGYIDLRHAVDPADSGIWDTDGTSGTGAAGFCTLSGGAVSACSLGHYTLGGTSKGFGYPADVSIPCIVYGYPGEAGTLPTIAANTNSRGEVSHFNVISAGSNLLYPPMVAPRGRWTMDGLHISARGHYEIIHKTGLKPSLFL